MKKGYWNNVLVYSWDQFAKENDLPQSNCYKQRFNGWNNSKLRCRIKIKDNKEKSKIQKDKILSTIASYKEQITTAKAWNEFATKTNLPPTHTIVYYFGSWDQFKRKLGIYIGEDEQKKRKQEKYLNIAKEHINEFSKSAENWKEYAKISGLPTTNTYIENFSSWANAQDLAGVNPKSIKSNVKEYNKDYLIKVAKENITHFKYTSKWERFAKENDLPNQYVYIRAFGSMVEAKKIVGISDFPTRKNYKKEELIQIALDNISYFTTQAVWDNFAEENSLPKNRVFTNTFGSWKETKQFIKKVSMN